MHRKDLGIRSTCRLDFGVTTTYGKQNLNHRISPNISCAVIEVILCKPGLELRIVVRGGLYMTNHPLVLIYAVYKVDQSRYKLCDVRTITSSRLSDPSRLPNLHRASLEIPPGTPPCRSCSRGSELPPAGQPARCSPGCSSGPPPTPSSARGPL